MTVNRKKLNREWTRIISNQCLSNQYRAAAAAPNMKILITVLLVTDYFSIRVYSRFLNLRSSAVEVVSLLVTSAPKTRAPLLWV
jgi:hypothetical protein